MGKFGKFSVRFDKSQYSFRYLQRYTQRTIYKCVIGGKPQDCLSSLDTSAEGVKANPVNLNGMETTLPIQRRNPWFFKYTNGLPNE